jgi:hypothetical protein
MKELKTVFRLRGINGPTACFSAKAVVLTHVTKGKPWNFAPYHFPISVHLWSVGYFECLKYVKLNK